jgi:F-type H+-transporting ATPase subunit b
MNALRRAAVAFGLAAAAMPALASEEGGGGAGASLIQPQIGTIFWTLLTFICLVVLMRLFAWKPLLGALQQREQSIHDTIEQARTDRDEAEGLLRQHKELLDQARRERAEAVADGQRDAEVLKAEILDEARKQREQLLAQTQTQIDAGLRQARAELREVAVDLAIRAAEKLISRNLDEPAQRRLVEEYLADLEKGGDSGTLPS